MSLHDLSLYWRPPTPQAPHSLHDALESRPPLTHHGEVDRAALGQILQRLKDSRVLHGTRHHMREGALALSIRLRR